MNTSSWIVVALAAVAAVAAIAVLKPARPLRSLRGTLEIADSPMGTEPTGGGPLNVWRQWWYWLAHRAEVPRFLQNNLWWLVIAGWAAIGLLLSRLPMMPPALPLSWAMAIVPVAVVITALINIGNTKEYAVISDARIFLDSIGSRLITEGNLSGAITRSWEGLPKRLVWKFFGEFVNSVNNNGQRVSDTLLGMAQRATDPRMARMAAQLKMANDSGDDPSASIRTMMGDLTRREESLRTVRDATREDSQTILLLWIFYACAIVASGWVAGSTQGAAGAINPWATTAGLVVSLGSLVGALLVAARNYSAIGKMIKAA